MRTARIALGLVAMVVLALTATGTSGAAPATGTGGAAAASKLVIWTDADRKPATRTGGDVLLPEGGEGPAIARLAELHASHALLDRPLQVLDLRLPDRLVLRPQPEPQPMAAGQRRPT